MMKFLFLTKGKCHMYCRLSPFHDIAIVKELFKQYFECNLFLGRS